MDRLEEMIGLEEVGDAVERLVIDQDSPKQRLLGLDIVRRGTERRFRRRLFACCRIECWHGPGQMNRRLWPFYDAWRICRRYSTSRITQRKQHSERAALHVQSQP